MTSVQPVKRSFCILNKIELEKAAELTPVDPSLIGLFRNATQQPRHTPRLEMMNGSKPWGLFGRFSGAESKKEAAKTAGVPFPLTPALPPQEREKHLPVLL